jgi:hypothetical protein
MTSQVDAPSPARCGARRHGLCVHEPLLSDVVRASNVSLRVSPTTGPQYSYQFHLGAFPDLDPLWPPSCVLDAVLHICGATETKIGYG